RMGIVNALALDGDLDTALESFVNTHFVPRSALSLRLATRAIREPRRVEVEQRLAETERLYLEELLATHDGVEGITAFIEKRPPEWRNA
ncbi:MAG: cyclohexa-1,5-dienecarbonyl-CoA hydratase, partial [Actinomycetota bacterium]|nr:cyclohexa-1,5-dienecarbonyl-CoA hydratase [Actinomycetota bacterium]